MLNRRAIALSALAVPIAAAPFGLRAQAAKPMVVFLGNDQCGFCKIWRAQAEPDFTSSDAFKKLDYRVVHPVTFEAMLEEKSWPDDLQWVLTDFLMSDEGAQHGLWTPRFFLVHDHKIALTVTGNDAWKARMLPAIAEATGAHA